MDSRLVRILAHVGATIVSLVWAIIILTAIGMLSIFVDGDNPIGGSLADKAWKNSHWIFFVGFTASNLAAHLIIESKAKNGTSSSKLDDQAKSDHTDERPGP
jgi:hypothetical protein